MSSLLRASLVACTDFHTPPEEGTGHIPFLFPGYRERVGNAEADLILAIVNKSMGRTMGACLFEGRGETGNDLAGGPERNLVWRPGRSILISMALVASEEHSFRLPAGYTCTLYIRLLNPTIQPPSQHARSLLLPIHVPLASRPLVGWNKYRAWFC